MCHGLVYVDSGSIESIGGIHRLGRLGMQFGSALQLFGRLQRFFRSPRRLSVHSLVDVDGGSLEGTGQTPNKHPTAGCREIEAGCRQIRSPYSTTNHRIAGCSKNQSLLVEKLNPKFPQPTTPLLVVENEALVEKLQPKFPQSTTPHLVVEQLKPWL